MKIYQINSSARKEGSTSRALAKKLLDKIKKPGDEIIYRDLDDEMLFVSGLTESGMKIPANKRFIIVGFILKNISLVINKTNKIISKPVISSKGFFNDENIKNFGKSLTGNINYFIKEFKNKKIIEILLKEKIKSFSQKFFRKALDMNPIIQIHIIRI